MFCVNYIASCQKSDGSFALKPNGFLSLLPTSGLAVRSLSWLGGLDRIDKDRCVSYLASCQGKDGSFSLVPSPIISEILFKAVVILIKMKELSLVGHMIGKKMPMERKAIVPPALDYIAVSALNILGASGKIDRDALLDFTLNCQNPDGGFGERPGAESEIRDTAHSVMTLNELGAIPRVGASN